MNYAVTSSWPRATATTMKRMTDVIGAALLLVSLSPIAVGIALAIRFRMGKPILFVQHRPGRGEVPFKMLKFRTMSDECGRDGAQLPDRDRVTTIGRVLRATSLDELPQLVNVLRGDMSFVGPRPLLLRYLPYFDERERLRFSVRPGITGLAQVTGRNTMRWSDRLALDVWYVENWSLWLDCSIAARTLWAILRRQGFEEDPESRMMNLDRERAEAEVGTQ